MKNIYLLSLIGAATVCFSACSKDDVKITDMALSSSQEYMLVGDTVLISATVSPTDASNKRITWSSSDESIVSIEDGVAVAQGSGNATVTASADNGLKTASCSMSVGDLYITGSDSYSTTSFPVVYKNNDRAVISDKYPYIHAVSIGVSGSDVYVSGTCGSGENLMPFICKNGDLQLLSPENLGYTVDGNCLCISGSDIYVAGAANGYGSGWEYIQEAYVWKNGVQTKLANEGGLRSYAGAIFASGDDIFVGGYRYVLSVFGYVATLWKNGEIYADLTDGTYDAYVCSVAVYGSDVYAGGYVYNDNFKIATVWKNGVATSLTDGTLESCVCEVRCNGNDWFAAGYKYNSTEKVFEAVLWKNGNAIVLSGEGKNAMVTSAFIFGDKIYVIGAVSGSPYRLTHVWSVDCKSGKILKDRVFSGLNDPGSLVIAQ